MKTNHQRNSNFECLPEMLPVIPTMDVVVFPNMIVPLLVLDEKIIAGIEQTVEETKLVLLLATKSQTVENGIIETSDLFTIGTIATIMRLIKLPEGGIKILVQGVQKAEAISIESEQQMLYARVKTLEYAPVNPQQIEYAIQLIKEAAEKMTASGGTMSPDFHIIISKMTDPEKIADFILSHLNFSVEAAQKLLEMDQIDTLLITLHQNMIKEIEVAEMQERIRSNARDAMNKSNKEFYLREQLRAIRQELGDDHDNDVDQFKAKLDALNASPEVIKEVSRQIDRLERTTPDSLEATVTRNHIEWILALPWGKMTVDNLDLVHARSILDQDHFGLKQIKERILDFISVRKLKEDGYAPILCFVGPPGTGKTSLGKSIADSLGRHYARISLGGVHDEAEIRGHRRTYVGAMPGRFIQAMRKAGSSNPVIVIDELDKIATNFRGDPSAAMLEVLDPQQNNSFYDNYIGLPFDLSHALFIATANRLDTISDPLRDRMEIIELSGYTYPEKMSICKKHLINKALIDTGLPTDSTLFSDAVIDDVINSYTRESGVRQLERTIKKMCCKAARCFVESGALTPFNVETIEKHLGPRAFPPDDYTKQNLIGISNGLAWTTCGGEMMKVEAMLMPGTGKLLLTGKLGDVLKESAQAAVSYVRAHAEQFGVNNDMFTTYDLHIHLPASAIPKDGPSAGITILTAVLSAYTKRAINADYAMTGEINLCGDIMPIGGIKEKILAAKRNRMKFVIAPSKNRNELSEVDDIITGIDIIWVEHAREVLEHIFVDEIPIKVVT